MVMAYSTQDMLHVQFLLEQNGCQINGFMKGDKNSVDLAVYRWMNNYVNSAIVLIRDTFSNYYECGRWADDQNNSIFVLNRDTRLNFLQMFGTINCA